MSTTESTADSTTPNAADAPAQDPALNPNAVSGVPDNLDSEIYDENGMARRGKNVYINDLDQTTTFHPLELPANPVARAMFPQHLISEENGFSESPMGNVHPHVRAEKGRAAQEQADRDFEPIFAAATAQREMARSESTQGTQGGETALEAQQRNNPDGF